MTLMLFGISNCDQVKAARQWLAAHQIDYQFHDVRADGLSLERLQQWGAQVGLDTLLNKLSTTWRQLSPQQQAAMQAGDWALIAQHPTVIKRPVLEKYPHIIIGFKPDSYAALL